MFFLLVAATAASDENFSKMSTVPFLNNIHCRKWWNFDKMHTFLFKSIRLKGHNRFIIWTQWYMNHEGDYSYPASSYLYIMMIIKIDSQKCIMHVDMPESLTFITHVKNTFSHKKWHRNIHATQEYLYWLMVSMNNIKQSSFSQSCFKF